MELTEDNQYSRFEFQNFGKIHIVVFYSRRFSPSVEYIDIVQKLEYAIQLSSSFALAFADIDAYPSAVEQFKIQSVPTVSIRSNPSLIPEFNGNIPPTSLFARLPALQAEFSKHFEVEKDKKFKLIDQVVKSHPLQLFIKGNPEQPKCKFTRQLLAELRPLNVRFGFYDIDLDQSMRHWLKLYSKWKTFPQIFVDGQLLGGLDVFREKLANGSFKPSAAMVVEQINSLQRIQQSHPCLILKSGGPNPDSQLALFLKENGVDFQFFNIELDNDLFTQLKARQLTETELLLHREQLHTFEQAKAIKF